MQSQPGGAFFTGQLQCR